MFFNVLSFICIKNAGVVATAAFSFPLNSFKTDSLSISLSVANI